MGTFIVLAVSGSLLLILPRAPNSRRPSYTRETKGESQEARCGFLITAWGYPGVNGGRRQRQNKSNQKLRNSPRRRRLADIDITHALELKCTTLSISRPAHFFLKPFHVSNQPNIACFSFFSRTRSFVPGANIYVTKYHQNS